MDVGDGGGGGEGERRGRGVLVGWEGEEVRTFRNPVVIGPEPFQTPSHCRCKSARKSAIRKVEVCDEESGSKFKQVDNILEEQNHPSPGLSRTSPKKLPSTPNFLPCHNCSVGNRLTTAQF